MRWMALAALAALVLAAPCAADEVHDALAQARTAYDAGEYKDASTHVQTALVGVNKRLTEQLIERMPAPPTGWQAEDPEGIDTASMGLGFFAGLVVSRTYTTPDGSTIDFTIAANSPMLATLRMFIGNPMLLQMDDSGMKKVSVCGYDAIEEMEDGAAIQVLGGNSTLISIEGDSVDDADAVRQLASATDCQGIVAIVE